MGNLDIEALLSLQLPDLVTMSTEGIHMPAAAGDGPAAAGVPAMQRALGQPLPEAMPAAPTAPQVSACTSSMDSMTRLFQYPSDRVPIGHTGWHGSCFPP